MASMQGERRRCIPPHLRPKPDTSAESHLPSSTSERKISCDAAIVTSGPQCCWDQSTAVCPEWPQDFVIEPSNDKIKHAEHFVEESQSCRSDQPAARDPRTPSVQRPRRSEAPLTPPPTNELICPRRIGPHTSTSVSRHQASSINTPAEDLVEELLGKPAPKSSQKKIPYRVQSKWVKSSQIPKGEKVKKVKKLSRPVPDLESRLTGWLTRSGEEQEDQVRLNEDVSALCWNERTEFKNNDLVGTIEAWRRTAIVVQGHEVKIDLPTEQQEPLPAIVPVTWMPRKIDGCSPLTFWNRIKQSAPAPVDEGDLERSKPWWVEFPPHHSPLLQQFDHPQIAGFDPDDETAAQRKARLADVGTMFIEQTHQSSIKIRQVSARQAKSRNAPRLRILIRAAVRDDMEQICAIYNHYIKWSVVIPDTEPILDHSTITKRWRKGQKAGLPMLVAVDPAYTIKDRKQREITIPEAVLGVAFLSDYPSELSTTHANTKRVHLFVHEQHYMQGIGKSLLDELIKTVVDTQKEQTSYQSEMMESPEAEIHKLVVHYLYDSARPEKVEIISALTSKFGFEQRDIVPHIAIKQKKRLNLAIFELDIDRPAHSVPKQSDIW